MREETVVVYLLDLHSSSKLLVPLLGELHIAKPPKISTLMRASPALYAFDYGPVHAHS